MAHHTTEGTGVLRLTAVTPVIQALFGGYALDASHPGEGQAYIWKSTDEGYATWEDVAGNLQDLAKELGLAEDEPHLSIPDLIELLAKHYAKGESVDLPKLDPEIEDDAHLDELFEIAKVLDDGHGLVSVEMQCADYCNKPWLGEFGGHGFYMGRGVVASSGAHTAVLVGKKLDEAVLAKDIDASVEILRKQLAETLNWISDPEVKLEVAKRLGLPG